MLSCKLQGKLQDELQLSLTFFLINSRHGIGWASLGSCRAVGLCLSRVRACKQWPRLSLPFAAASVVRVGSPLTSALHAFHFTLLESIERVKTGAAAAAAAPTHYSLTPPYVETLGSSGGPTIVTRQTPNISLSAAAALELPAGLLPVFRPAGGLTWRGRGPWPRTCRAECDKCTGAKEVRI